MYIQTSSWEHFNFFIQRRLCRSQQFLQLRRQLNTNLPHHIWYRCFGTDVKSLNDPNKLMRDLFIEKNHKRWIKYSAVHRIPIEEDFCWCIWVAFFNWIYTGNYQMLNMLKTISFSHWIYVTVFKWTTMWYVFSCYSRIFLKNPL